MSTVDTANKQRQLDICSFFMFSFLTHVLHLVKVSLVNKSYQLR